MATERVCVACGVVHSRPGWSAMCIDCFRAHEQERIKAIAAVGKAIARGELPKAVSLACVDCGKPARDYDHRDYTRQLDVVPVCRSCNLLRGSAFSSFYRPAEAV